MFGLSVVVLILAIYLVVVLALGGLPSHGGHHGNAISGVWYPEIFVPIALGTIVVVSLASLYKIAELSAGGEKVAQMFGGRAVDPQTIDPAERRLLNVVEEMAVASGVPVPPVYVLDRETSINAFAAGHQPGDAVVAVSRGCLDYLTREELQGVLGHEFSHILNGDMRLNLRLVGIVYGILVLSIIGYYIMRLSGSVSSSSDEKKSGAGFFVVGLALYILGSLGVLLGQIIKSAVSRQREYLADAASVQFTRNPAGLAGALKKIGGLTNGSRVRDAHAQEISHMFFSDAFAGSFLNLFGTHPPLVDRIRQLDPQFDGHFPEVRPLVEAAKPAPAAKPVRKTQLPLGLPLPALASASGAADCRNLVGQIGSMQAANLEQAGRRIDEVPQALVDAAREPFGAQAVIYALLLSGDDEATRTAQLEMLRTSIAAPLAIEARQLGEAARTAPSGTRMTLVDLAIPALKRISAAQYGPFRKTVEKLTEADGHIDLFEYCLRVVLFEYLDIHFGLKRPAGIRYRTLNAVRPSIVSVLSLLAYAGQTREGDADRAFRAGAGKLPGGLLLLPREQCTLAAFNTALIDLAQTTPEIKRRVISAMVECLVADGTATDRERELLRAIAAALACPMPPIVVENR